MITRATAFLIILASAAAQTPDASPRFEVASIKPSPPPEGGRMRFRSDGGPGTDDPGLFTCERCSVSSLLLKAFDIQTFQLSGPDWLQSPMMQATQFNISAKIPEGSTKEQFHLMMRNLLIDRFQLKFHYDKKEMQAYDLVVAKNGSKMKESPGPPDPDERPGRIVGERKMDADGFVILPPGRVPMMMTMAGGRAVMREAEVTMTEFATRLEDEVGRPIADATGLKGKYDFTLRWIEGRAGPVATDENAPNIFRALQEQLGLKLESKKSMASVLVVDHIEKNPTEN
jgi:uncharacterized protein (TIGR03435 family)